jgi:uncharacterized protein YkwD
MTKNSARWTSTVVRLWIGCVAFATLSAGAQAQTYYYYPSSVTSVPTVARGATVAPTYYYVQPTYQYQVAPTRYAPQYYQTVYAPQYYQQAPAPQYYQTAYQTQSPQYYQTAYQTQSPQYYQTAYQTQTPQASNDAQIAQSSGVPVAQSTDTPVAPSSGDPYGFTGWLNSVRASYGLSAVGYDANLSSWAAENNNHQAARGMGHYVMGSARRQNSAMGSFANIGSMWMNSPAHRAALLDPTITAIGIAGLGAYWTFNAY